MEGPYKTTTPDSFAYTWGVAEDCVMTKILTQDAKMSHYLLTSIPKKVNSSSSLNSTTLKRNEHET